MRLLICGDRDWEDKFLIGEIIDDLSETPTVIIEGGARGADLLAHECAEDRGIPVEEYSAQWNKYGRGAGPIRNQQMLDEGNVTQVFAFHDDMNKSRGTKDMINRARKHGIPVTVISHQEIRKINSSVKEFFND